MPSTPIAQNGLRDWLAEWAEFQRRHSDFASVEPIYSLPDVAVDLLAGSWGHRAPVLEPTRAQSEREFTELCNRHKVIGVWDEQMVRYEYLLPDLPPIRAKQVPAGYESYLRALAAAEDKSKATRSRLRGVAGWLLTEPSFLREVAAVREKWEALATAARPTFPLTRALRVDSPPPGSTPADTATSSYAAAFHDLMDRWGLMTLVTWDLPEPQGPLLPTLLPPGAQAMPRHGVQLVVPIHYPLKGDDDLLHKVQEQQQMLARTLGIDETFAGVPHHEPYDYIFRLIHLDRAMRARVPAGRSVRGLVGLIERAAMDVLKISKDYFDKLCKGMRKCLRGERAEVSWHRRCR